MVIVDYITRWIQRLLFRAQKGLLINPFYKYLRDNILVRNRKVILLVVGGLLLNILLFVVWRYDIDTSSGIRYIEENPIINSLGFISSDTIVPLFSFFLFSVNSVVAYVFYRVDGYRWLSFVFLSFSVIIAITLLVVSNFIS